jgi:hypothetical protein
MLSRIIADVTEMSVIGLFLGMIWLWASAITPAAGV